LGSSIRGGGRRRTSRVSVERPWPLVGRDAECNLIEGALADPEVEGVAIVGEADVGRTRLAREVVRRLTASGRQTEWVAANAAPRSAPFGAVAHLVPAGGPPEDSPVAVVNAVAQRCAALGGRQRVAVAVDDAHLLDEQSAALVAQLAIRGLAFVVVTVERGQPTPHPIGALWADGGVIRVDLPPLDAAAIDLLLDEALGGAVDGITRRRLRVAASGRPGVLRELLACGVDSGALRQSYGIWRWHGRMEGSRRTVEHIAAELASCPTEVRRALEVVACGEPLSLRILEQLADGPAIEAAERSGLLRVDVQGRASDPRHEVRLANPLHAAALRDSMPVTRGRSICRQLAEAVASEPSGSRHEAVRVAGWQFEAGAVTVPEVLLPAARTVRTSDPVFAEWCARAACDLGGGSEAHLLLAEILEYGGRVEEAAAVLDAAPEDRRSRGARAATQATVYYWGLGQVGRAQDALDLPGTDPGQDLADALRTWLLLFDGSYGPALDVARSVLSRTGVDDQAVVWAAAGGIGAAGLLGRLREATTLHGRGRAVAHAHPVDLPWARPQVDYAICGANYFCGHLLRADLIADQGYRAAAELQEPLMLGIWSMLRGVCATSAGRVVTAQSSLKEAIALLEDTDTRLLDFCCVELASACALAGDHIGAAAWLDRSHAHGAAANRAFDPWRERARAWVLAARGATSEAVEILLAAAPADCPTAEAHLLYDVARLGAASQVRTRLHELAEVIEGPFVAALAICATGMASSAAGERTSPVELADAAGTLAELGHTLLAAEAMHVAARSYRRLGLRSKAQLHHEYAIALDARCEGAGTPLLAFCDTESSLTRREREVALLAARLASKDIAAELGLAVSTVNNHLARAYVKLGISGRAELGALLDVHRS